MTQTATLKALDATLHSAFADAGMADTGTYTAPSGSPVACRVMVDHVGAVAIDENGRAVGAGVQLRIWREDVATPQARGVVVVDGATYKLDSLIERDESVSIWSVIP